LLCAFKNLSKSFTCISRQEVNVGMPRRGIPLLF